MELKFKMGEFFPESSVVGRWIMVLSIIMNDILLPCKLLTDLVEQNENDASATAKKFYYFRLGSSHLREAIKWLDISVKNSDIEKFIKSFDAGASGFLKIKSLYDTYEGSFVEKILKPVRDDFFHYPKLDSKKLQGALKDSANNQTSVSFKTGSLSDTRFLYGDDLSVAMFSDSTGGHLTLKVLAAN